MKHSAKKYAKALADSLEDKKTDSKKISAHFLKLLEKNGDLKKANQIIALAQSLLLQKSGNKKVLLETARKMNTKDFQKKFIKKGDLVQEKVNSELVAGIKIIVDGQKQLDLSLAYKLEKIFNV